MPSATSRQDRVREILEPAVAALGCDLEDVQVSQAGRRSVIRVIVDRDGGIDLDAVAQASRAVSEALDEAERTGAAADPGPYVLEVSSPGVDRPLTQPRHWRRNIGRLVSVTASGAALTGRITAVDEGGVTLEVKGRSRSVPFAQLGAGKVQVEFGRIADGALDDGDLDDLDDRDLGEGDLREGDLEEGDVPDGDLHDLHDAATARGEEG